MKLNLWLFIFNLQAASVATAADFIFNPRYEVIRQNEPGKEILIHRTLIQSHFLAQSSRAKFYIDGFGEYEGAPSSQREWRRQENRAYLQEAYVEFTGDIFFMKIGQQALRWSDSWIIPSLDVWTARRYERIFVDPLPQQLSHSAGAVFTMAQEEWSADLALMPEAADDSFPKPFHKKLTVQEKEPLNMGLRTKFEVSGFQSTLVAARVLRKNTFGYAASYAFEEFVPKFEIGITQNEQKDDALVRRRLSFASLGADIFIGQLTLTPQVTAFDGLNPYLDENDAQALSYLSCLYTSGRHEWQWQSFTNSIYKSSFWGGLYTYTIQQKWSLSALVQNYSGFPESLLGKIQTETGGFLVGFRAQFTTVFFKKD